MHTLVTLKTLATQYLCNVKFLELLSTIFTFLALLEISYVCTVKKGRGHLQELMWILNAVGAAAYENACQAIFVLKPKVIDRLKLKVLNCLEEPWKLIQILRVGSVAI